MPRRLAVAKQAGGFDALGWTLLGFLLGASLAVFALLHADISGITRPLTGAAARPPPVPVIRYSPPPTANPPLAGASRPLPADLTPTQTPLPAAPLPAAPLPSGVSALASAGAVSAHAAKAGAAPATPKAAAVRSPAPSTPAEDAQVADDAAASGMTSRAGAAPAPQGQALY